MKTLLSWIALVAAAVVAHGDDAFAERRVALVVGNAAYAASDMWLHSPRNDAEDMSSALKGLGFEVVTATDATRRQMDVALQQFTQLAIGADSALFFYSGHALQFQGRNYLMPTDAELEDELSIRYQTVSLEDVRAALDHTKGVRIVILDACHNNPVAFRLQTRRTNLARVIPIGLARVEKAEGMVVVFATAADDIAWEGKGRNSPLTSALLKRFQEPSVEIGILLRRVASDVNAQTQGRQRPEIALSLLTDYYLNQNGR